MLDFHQICEFSRINCITICTFLVPFNLLATLQTLIFTGQNRSKSQILLIAGFASLYSGLMVLHVFTWFLVGVVRIPTYVLLLLGSTCLSINLWAVLYTESLKTLIDSVVVFAQKLFRFFGTLSMKWIVAEEGTGNQE